MGLHKMKIEVIMEERFIVKLITTVSLISSIQSFQIAQLITSPQPGREFNLFRGGRRATKESEHIQ